MNFSRNRRRLEAWLAVLAIIGLAPAENLSAEPLPDGSITINGTAVDESGQPVAGAVVRLLAHRTDIAATSDSAGRFRIVAPQEQKSVRMVVARDPEGKRSGYLGLGYTTENRAITSENRIVLRTVKPIAVAVVNGAGKPVAGADVVAVSEFQIFDQRQTAVDGRAELTVPVDAPLDHVLASKRGVGLDYVLYREPGAANSEPAKRPSDDREPIRLVINGVIPMTIRVVDGAGKPIPNVKVWPWLIHKPDHGGFLNLCAGDTMPDFESLTNADGRTSFAVVPADNLSVVEFWTKLDGYFTPHRCVVDPKTMAGETTVAMVRLTAAKGRVSFADGRPAPGIPVVAVGSCGGEDFDAKAVSAADGSFELAVAPEMYYLIVAGNKEWASAAATRVVRSGRTIAPIELTVGPARRVFGRATVGYNQTPAADVWATLYQVPQEDYYRLPPSERLPDRPPGSHAVHPLYSRWLKTDAEGRFEHFVGPGKYYIVGPSNANQPKFEIDQQPFVEANLHADQPERGRISGRVVRRDNPTTPVPGARIRAGLTDRATMPFEAGTDADGRFEAEGPLGDMLVLAASADGKLTGFARRRFDQELIVPVGPPGSARGRLIDPQNRLPIVNGELLCAVQIALPDDMFTHFFEESVTTDDGGGFTLAHLAVGLEYVLSAVMDRDSSGRAYGWTPIATIKVDDAKDIALGDIVLERPDRPPALEERIAQRFAVNTPLPERLHRGIQDARLFKQRLLVVASTPTSKTGRQFFAHYLENEQVELRGTFARFRVVAVDAGVHRAESLPDAMRFAFPDSEGLSAAIIDESGKLAGTFAAAAVSTGGTIDEQLLLAELQKYDPTLPDAELLFNEALASAKREEKRVLVELSAEWCAPCLEFARYLDQHRTIFEKDYVLLTLDRRFRNANKVVDSLQPGQGIPWTTILDPAGRRLASSDSPDGNIGFPSTLKEIAHFESMLRQTARRLSEDDIQKLLAALRPKDRSP